MSIPSLAPRRTVLAGLLATPLLGCDDRPKPPPPRIDLPATPVGSLEWAAAGPWRIDRARDAWRHPVETLKFFGIRPDMNVLEVLPGRGWYTAILAPFLAKGGGRLKVASFDPATATPAQTLALEGFAKRFLSDPGTYGAIEVSAIGPTIADLAPEGSVDLALVMRNVHTFMAEGYVERAFRAIHRALKPGGVLGIEEHRARSTGLQDPRAGDGYVQDGNAILLVGSYFTSGTKNCSITYTAGFGATVPGDVQQAVAEMVAAKYRGKDRINIASAQFAGESASYLTDRLTEAVSSVVSKYQRVRV